jgi:hypothetical protein
MGQGCQPADQPILEADMVMLCSLSEERTAARNGVSIPDALVYQVVIPEPNCRKPLLQRRVADALPSTIEVSAQLTNEERDMLQSSACSVHPVFPAEPEVLIETATICVDRCRRTL